MNTKHIDIHERGSQNPLPTATPIPSQLRTGYVMTPPITFRLPKPGAVDPYFGAARTFWNERVLPSEANGFKPPIKSMVERKKGAIRGIRFILYESALEYFTKRIAEQNAGKEEVC